MADYLQLLVAALFMPNERSQRLLASSEEKGKDPQDQGEATPERREIWLWSVVQKSETRRLRVGMSRDGISWCIMDYLTVSVENIV